MVTRGYEGMCCAFDVNKEDIQAVARAKVKEQNPITASRTEDNTDILYVVALRNDNVISKLHTLTPDLPMVHSLISPSYCRDIRQKTDNTSDNR